MFHSIRPFCGLATVAAITLGLCSCGDDSACEPGATMACECPGAGPSVRTCLEDGILWGACECGGSGGSGGTGASGGTGGTGAGGSGGDAGAGGATGGGGGGGTHAGGAPSGSGG